jgi:hypothetical protein
VNAIRSKKDAPAPLVLVRCIRDGTRRGVSTYERFGPSHGCGECRKQQSQRNERNRISGAHGTYPS